MNYLLDAILIAIAFLFILLGAKKGFAKSFIEIIGYLLSIMIAFSLADYVSDYVYQENLRPAIISAISDNAEKSGKNAAQNIDDVWESMPSFVTAISKFTDFSKESLKKSLGTDLKNNAEVTAGRISDTVIKPIAVSAIKFIVAILSLILLLILVKILARLIGKAFNASIFRGLNRAMGGLTGLIKGIIIIYLAICLLTWCLPLFGNKIWFITPQLIDKTTIFKAFYNVNIF